MMRFRHTCLLALVAILIACSLPALAQTETPDKPAPETHTIDPDVVRSKIEETEASSGLDEASASSLLDYYRRTLSNLEQERAADDQAEALDVAGSEAPDALQQTREELTELRQKPPPDKPRVSAQADVNELENTLSEQRSALNELESGLADLRERHNRQVARPGAMRDEITQVRADYEKSLVDVEGPVDAGDNSVLSEAMLWYLVSRENMLAAELRKLEQERLTYDARFELLSARLELQTEQVERARAEVAGLEQLVSERRSNEAEEARQQALATDRALEVDDGRIRKAAAENIAMGEQLTQRQEEINTASTRRDEVQEELERVRRELSVTRSKLAIAGLNQALGQLLVDQRRELPNLRGLKKEEAELNRQVATVSLEQLDLGEQWRQLGNANALIEEMTADLDEQQAAAVRQSVTDIARARLELIDQSLANGSRYLSVLGELDLGLRQLATAVSEYQSFLDSNLLWVRNSASLDISVLKTLPEDVTRLFSRDSWGQLFRDVSTTQRDRPWLAITFVILLVLALVRKRFLNGISASARNVNRIRDYRFRDSMACFGYTMLSSGPLPMAIILLGWAALANVNAAEFSQAIGMALVMVGSDLLLIQFFLDAGRSDGLLRKHCDWMDEAVDRLVRELRWFRLAFPALRFIAVSSFTLDAPESMGGMAVLGAIGAGLALGLLFYRLFVKNNGVFSDFLRQNSRGLIAQTRRFWQGLLVTVMPALVLIWLAGYNYTGQELAFSVMYTFWLVLVLMVLQGLLARWLLFGHQRMQLLDAIEQRDAARAARAAAAEEQDDEQAQDEIDYEVEEQKIDYASLSSDSRFLLNSILVIVALFCFWVIWAPIIPALGFLDTITLWTKAGALDGETAQIPVTLLDLMLAISVGVIAGVAAKGVPALVELMILNRTQMSFGSRYTTSTLLRYTIVGTGAIVAINMLGLGWSKVQWLVAALGVGIGFGLQEIVANFISGLVILFERPIRVGDIVTVGETSGVVTKIQIRATTIRDWDRRELLVPNKEFITARLLNWSLSDNVLRTVIPFGVAYGSDVDKAMRLAEEAAEAHPNVLEDPAPFAIFEGFGDDALNLSLRIYLPSFTQMLTTKSELHLDIMARLDEAGIVIAFPQRDVHLDTTEPLEIRVRTDRDAD